MAEKRGNYEYRDDGTVGTLVTAETIIEGAEATVPVDIQSRYATTIQTHNAVSVPLSSTSTGSFIDVDGFDKISVIATNDNTTSTWAVNLIWSIDGVTDHGYEILLASGALGNKTIKITDTKARYVKVQLQNTDATLAHTMSAWAYLKA